MEVNRKQVLGNEKGIKTTVVIPNYNGINYIEDCMESLLKSDVPLGIIVVDNKSGDGSRELLAEKYGDLQQVELIFLEENTGFCHAVNVGIQAAKTEYVFLLNNDTVVEEDCVSELEKQMLRSQDIFSVGSKMINMRNPDKIDDAGDLYCALGWAFARGKDKERNAFDKEDRIFAACAGAALYRRSIFDAIGLFDEAHFAYLEDIDIGYRANIHGYHNVFAPKAIVYHAGSAVSGSRHNEFKVDLSARNSIYLIYKNMPFLQILLNLPFLLAGYLIKWFFFALKGLGGVYRKGIGKGFVLAFSGKGRAAKQRFKAGNFSNYLWIQWQLWINTLRRFF